MPIARLTIEYDGTDFRGWARQPGLRTVQEELERALGVVLRREPVELAVAGRTDTGVHALAQVASYAGEPASVEHLNSLLPADIAALGCAAAGEDFNARVDATSRAYTYRLLTRQARSALHRGRALHWFREIDLEALHACAAALVGRHDFRAFTPKETEHVHFTRVVYAAFWRVAADGERLELWIEADAFLRHMIRVLVGTMLDVAAGKRPVEEFAALLAGAPRSDAGRTAPAHGLYLAGVGYDDERVIAPSSSVDQSSHSSPFRVWR